MIFIYHLLIYKIHKLQQIYVHLFFTIFFKKRVVQISNQMEDIFPINWKLNRKTINVFQFPLLKSSIKYKFCIFMIKNKIRKVWKIFKFGRDNSRVTLSDHVNLHNAVIKKTDLLNGNVSLSLSVSKSDSSVSHELFASFSSKMVKLSLLTVSYTKLCVSQYLFLIIIPWLHYFDHSSFNMQEKAWNTIHSFLWSLPLNLYLFLFCTLQGNLS